jgi:hypothetical protein
MHPGQPLAHRSTAVCWEANGARSLQIAAASAGYLRRYALQFNPAFSSRRDLASTADPPALVGDALPRLRRYAESRCAHTPPASTSGALGPLPAEALARVEYVAKWIQSRRIHYCWGGGHAAQPGPSAGSYCWSASGQQVFGAPEKGLDCSGAVRWLLVLSGYPDPGGLVSNELGAHYPAGPGRAVTIWSNVDHVFLEINGRDWRTSDSNFAHGPGFGSQPTAGFVASHPQGL